MNTILFQFARIIDIMFPRICSGCKNAGTFLCDDCFARIPRADAPSESFITAIFDYQNPTIRHTIWRFKYKNARGVAEHFGGVLYDEILGEISDDVNIAKDEVLLIVPIPLHKTRLRERGYNQSELLVKEVLKHDNRNILKFAPNTIVRSRATNAQAKKEGRAARFENMRGVFIVKSEIARGKHVILIDDVTTTGATLSEARKTLLKAGARSVRAYTIAH